jgi:hypothetical protein
VPHFCAFNGNEAKYNFAIPASVKFAVHANALNEHRGGLANFHALSILPNASAADNPWRIERGFLGAHSDIGGSYSTGDLSDISLMWMVEQAAKVGVNVDMEMVEANKWNIVENPLLHNSNTNWSYYLSDRRVKYGDGTKVMQKEKKDAAKMTYQDTLAFITDISGDPGADLVEGVVDVKGYCEWLNKNNYFEKKDPKWLHPCQE